MRPVKRNDWNTLKRLIPYLWEYRWRVLLALLMVGAKLANIGVPLLLKQLVDAMNVRPGERTGPAGGAGGPVAGLWLVAAGDFGVYGVARAGVFQGDRGGGAQRRLARIPASA